MHPSTAAQTPNALLISPEGRFLDANGLACQALGYGREELLTLAVWDIDLDFPRDRWPEHWHKLRQAKTLCFQTTYRTREGSQFPVEIVSHYLELDGREYNSVLAYPLTPQWQTETALRKSEERLALALAVSGQGLYDLDIAAGKAVFSDEYARMLGYEPSELQLTPTGWTNWLHPDDRAWVLQLYEECITGKLPDYHAEFRLRTRSGDWIWVRSVGRIVQRDAAGRPVRMIGTHLDITERKRTEAALRESEARFAKAFHANPALMCITDIATGRFLDANARLLDQLEYAREQIIGHTSVELDFYADPGAREQMIERLRQQGFVREMPIRFRTRTGKILETLYSAEILHLGEQRVLLSLVHDITDRQRAEQSLRQSEERFAKAFQASPAPMLITTLHEGRIIDVNARGLSLVGATREELIGHTTNETGIWIAPGTRDRMIAQLRKTGTFKDIPIVLHTRSGGLREILWSAELITLGNQPALLSLAYDLTEQRRAEQALQASEQRYRTIFETAAVSIREEDMSVVKAALDALEAQGIADIRAYLTQHPAFVADCVQQVRIMDVNQQTLKLFGASSKAELLGGLNRILLPESLPAFTEILIAIAEGKRHFEVETVHQTLQGERRNALLTVAFPEPDAPFTNVLISMMDITERKRVEEELQRYREHLEERVAERTAELRQVMTQLMQAEKLAALGSLVAGVAHELSTPLGNTRVVASSLGDDLRAFAAAVESGSLRRSQVEAFLSRGCEAVDLLERNTARAADLIGHFKQVAVDQTSMRRRRFHLRQTVEELLVTLQPLFKRTAHRIEREIPPDLELDSYPGPLEQVIVNLINNSLIHGFVAREAGLIRLHAEAFDADRVQLRYADDGVGISEKIQNRIFDPFFTTQLGSGGSGLGLYIVYNIVTVILGGTIQVQGSPGAGTTFTLILPRIAPNRPALAPAA